VNGSDRRLLTRFLGYDIGAHVAGLVMLTAVHLGVTSRPEILWLATVVAAHLIMDVVVLLRRRGVRAGGDGRLIVVLAVSTWAVNAIITLIVPAVVIIMIISALTPAIVAVPYLRRRPFRRLMAALVGIVTLLTAVSCLTGVSSIAQAVPGWVMDGILIGFVPIVTGTVVLLLWHSNAWLLTALAEAEDANTALREAQRRVHEHARQLRDSRARVVAAGDTERRRMERDLHDGAQQPLIAAAIAVRRLRALREGDPRRDDLLDQVSAHLERATVELRQVAAGIYPAVLSDHGLAAALVAVCAASPVPVHVVDATTGRYPSALEAAVYFCCREAVQNAAKHAGPTARVTIALSAVEGVLACTITDDGVGFDVGAGLPATAGRGLTNMADRVEATGGELLVDSAPGRGTRLCIRLPVTAARAQATAGEPPAVRGQEALGATGALSTVMS